MNACKYAGDCVIITKNGKMELCKLTNKDMVLCSDNSYHKVVEIEQAKNDVLSIKGFWFNTIKVTSETPVYVCKRERVSSECAEYILAKELLEDDNWKKYYICTFSKFFDGVMDDAVYDNEFAWIPFKIINEDRKSETFTIKIEGNYAPIVNNCRLAA